MYHNDIKFECLAYNFFNVPEIDVYLGMKNRNIYRPISAVHNANTHA